VPWGIAKRLKTRAIAADRGIKNSKFAASSAAPIDSEIPRVASTPCKPNCAQAPRPFGAPRAIHEAYIRDFRLRVVNACVFLKCALGRPERYQKQRLCLALIADENSFCLPVSAETVVREVD